MKIARVSYTLGESVLYPLKEHFSLQDKLKYLMKSYMIPNILESSNNTAC